MYSPFEINNYLGPIMVLGALKAAGIVTIALIIYSAYLKEEENELK